KEYNNAHFMNYLRYHSGQDHFRKIFIKCSESWECFFKNMKQLKSLPASDRNLKLLEINPHD
ncbi:MAG: aminopeptidase, partial [Spirochaetia bacterium]|nr:aminopeptidase [Spirochaetia bacterium]